MLRPRPNVERIRLPAHGGINHEELKRLGVSPEDVIDFSVSVNPFGPPPGMGDAICKVPLDRYPDSDATNLRRAIANKLGVQPENILAGSGSTEIIRLVAAAYFGPDDLVVIPEPTYGEYETACHLSSARVLKASMLEEPGFRVDAGRLVDLIKERRPSGIFLCNPNNPTGHYLSQQEVSRIVCEAGDCLVVLDEAYVAFSEDAWPSVPQIERGNVVIVRSMTKDYALAGLRLGYAVAPDAIISTLRRIKPPWNVSSLAQAAGVFALDADAYIEASADKIATAKEFLVRGLQRLGFSPLPSSANFFLVEVGEATALRQALLKRGIIVRDCASFGLPNYIRLAPRVIPECERLLAALASEEVRHAG